jgi:uncharacterized protein YndB with AHSA1/START domain
MYGTLEEDGDGRWRLQFSRSLDAPPEKVWRAITEPEHLACWFPTTIEGERATGAHLRFVFPGNEAPPFEGEMLAFEPPSLMELQWGPDIVRLELRPSGDGTTLTLLTTLEERGKAARDGAGWHLCLDGLAARLRGEPHAGESKDIWRALNTEYVASFGAEAATIGPPEGFE